MVCNLHLSTQILFEMAACPSVVGFSAATTHARFQSTTTLVPGVLEHIRRDCGGYSSANTLSELLQISYSFTRVNFCFVVYSHKQKAPETAANFHTCIALGTKFVKFVKAGEDRQRTGVSCQACSGSTSGFALLPLPSITFLIQIFTNTAYRGVPQ